MIVDDGVSYGTEEPDPEDFSVEYGTVECYTASGSMIESHVLVCTLTDGKTPNMVTPYVPFPASHGQAAMKSVVTAHIYKDGVTATYTLTITKATQ